MTTNNLHIVLIEPSSIVYEGLCTILGYSDNQFKITRFESIEEIPNYLIRKKVDILIINPGLIRNNLKTYNSIRSSLPQAKFIGIVYSFFDQHLLSAFDDIISIYDNPEFIIGHMQRPANQRMDSEHGHQQEKLSERETDVLKLLTSGNSNKEIADQLNISTHTVISHRKNITQKTGIKSVSGLTIYAVVKNIITLDNYKDQDRNNHNF